jgi:hypothetical protein
VRSQAVALVAGASIHYLKPMLFSRLLSVLVLLAVLLAPAGMLGSHAAMAMPAQPSASGLCSEQQHEGGGESQAMIDCAIACTALPSHQPVPAEAGPALAPAHLAALVRTLDGTQPEAVTPPPRFS